MNYLSNLSNLYKTNNRRIDFTDKNSSMKQTTRDEKNSRKIMNLESPNSAHKYTEESADLGTVNNARNSTALPVRYSSTEEIPNLESPELADEYTKESADLKSVNNATNSTALPVSHSSTKQKIIFKINNNNKKIYLILPFDWRNLSKLIPKKDIPKKDDAKRDFPQEGENFYLEYDNAKEVYFFLLEHKLEYLFSNYKTTKEELKQNPSQSKFIVPITYVGQQEKSDKGMFLLNLYKIDENNNKFGLIPLIIEGIKGGRKIKKNQTKKQRKKTRKERKKSRVLALRVGS